MKEILDFSKQEVIKVDERMLFALCFSLTVRLSIQE